MSNAHLATEQVKKKPPENEDLIEIFSDYNWLKVCISHTYIYIV